VTRPRGAQDDSHLAWVVAAAGSKYRVTPDPDRRPRSPAPPADVIDEPAGVAPVEDHLWLDLTPAAPLRSLDAANSKRQRVSAASVAIHAGALSATRCARRGPGKHGQQTAKAEQGEDGSRWGSLPKHCGGNLVPYRVPGRIAISGPSVETDESLSFATGGLRRQPRRVPAAPPAPDRCGHANFGISSHEAANDAPCHLTGHVPALDYESSFDRFRPKSDLACGRRLCRGR
jgi:hypothetical protein